MNIELFQESTVEPLIPHFHDQTNHLDSRTITFETNISEKE
jgi:hypothetical protein